MTQDFLTFLAVNALMGALVLNFRAIGCKNENAEDNARGKRWI